MLYKQEIKTILNNSIDEMTNALENNERRCQLRQELPEDKLYNLCAVSGDLSAYGISGKATVIPIKREQMQSVMTYIEIQKIYGETLSILSDDIYKAHNKYPAIVDTFEELWRKSNALMADIFNNKYCYRTEWAFK